MNLAEMLRSPGLILLDGAMGTELDRRGYRGGPLNNLSNPAAVSEIHQDYLAAGSMALITNTLTMNRIYVETHHLEVDLQEINRAGAGLAAAALRSAGLRGSGFVLGNLGSTGQMLEPLGLLTPQQITASFREQAGFLAEAGVDGFIIETMVDLREAVCALRGCRLAAPQLPVIASMAFYTTSAGGRTAMGNSADECARLLAEEGADAVGANCGSLEPEQLAEIVSVMARATSVPITVEPNAGRPRLVSGCTSFDMTPATLANGVLRCRQAGARILGGCCGTTPEHLRALIRMIRG